MLGYVHRRTTDHVLAHDKSGNFVTSVISCGHYVFGIDKSCKNNSVFFYLQKWFWNSLTTSICNHFAGNGIRETSQISYLMRKPYERRFGQPFKGPIIPFGSLVEYHPNCEDQQESINLERSLTWIVPRIRIARGVNLEG